METHALLLESNAVAQSVWRRFIQGQQAILFISLQQNVNDGRPDRDRRSPIAAAALSPPFGKWTRLSEDPIISPRGEGWESAGTFNPSVVKKDGKFVMLYRAQDRKGTSSLGYASSDDVIHFTRRAQPVLTAEAPYEKGGGVEDPRLQKFGDTYYVSAWLPRRCGSPVCDSLRYWSKSRLVGGGFRRLVRLARFRRVIAFAINGRHLRTHRAEIGRELPAMVNAVE